jgi:hypothetical protein
MLALPPREYKKTPMPVRVFRLVKFSRMLIKQIEEHGTINPDHLQKIKQCLDAIDNKS